MVFPLEATTVKDLETKMKSLQGWARSLGPVVLPEEELFLAYILTEVLPEHPLVLVLGKPISMATVYAYLAGYKKCQEDRNLADLLSK